MVIWRGRGILERTGTLMISSELKWVKNPLYFCKLHEECPITVLFNVAKCTGSCLWFRKSKPPGCNYFHCWYHKPMNLKKECKTTNIYHSSFALCFSYQSVASMMISSEPLLNRLHLAITENRTKQSDGAFATQKKVKYQSLYIVAILVMSCAQFQLKVIIDYFVNENFNSSVFYT